MKNQSKEQSPASISKDDDLVKRTRIAFFISSSLVMLFAVRYGYLEYYYINDPDAGKDCQFNSRRKYPSCSTPILGDLYSYHVFPMLVIFILVGFGPFFDSHSFNILGRHERRKSASLGVASVISAILVEDFAWFFFRWGLPLDNDPKRGMLMQVGLDNTHNIGGLTILKSSSFGSGFVIPYWYIIAGIIAGFFFYYAFKKSKKSK